MNSRSSSLTGRSVVACVRCCAGRRNEAVSADVARTISAGQILSSRKQVCSPCTQAGLQRDNPDEVTANWRAVCGRTARTVRRAGTAESRSRPLSCRRCPERGAAKLAPLRYTQTDAAPFPAPGTADTAHSTGFHCHFKNNGNGHCNCLGASPHLSNSALHQA